MPNIFLSREKQVAFYGAYMALKAALAQTSFRIQIACMADFLQGALKLCCLQWKLKLLVEARLVQISSLSLAFLHRS